MWLVGGGSGGVGRSTGEAEVLTVPNLLIGFAHGHGWWPKLELACLNCWNNHQEQYIYESQRERGLRLKKIDKQKKNK